MTISCKQIILLHERTKLSITCPKHLQFYLIIMLQCIEQVEIDVITLYGAVEKGFASLSMPLVHRYHRPVTYIYKIISWGKNTLLFKNYLCI